VTASISALGFPGAWLQAGDIQVHLIEVPADASTGTRTTQVARNLLMDLGHRVASLKFLISDAWYRKTSRTGAASAASNRGGHSKCVWFGTGAVPPDKVDYTCGTSPAAVLSLRADC
jgi:hypothetical protein